MSNSFLEFNSTKNLFNNYKNGSKHNLTQKESEIHTKEIEESTREFLSRIAKCAKQIIINPHVHLMDILFIFDHYKTAPDIIILTLFKIFKEILPNYQPVKGNTKQSKYEKDLMMVYEKYLGILLRSPNKSNTIDFDVKSELQKDAHGKNNKISSQKGKSTVDKSQNPEEDATYSQNTVLNNNLSTEKSQYDNKIPKSQTLSNIFSKNSLKHSDFVHQYSSFQETDISDFKSISEVTLDPKTQIINKYDSAPLYYVKSGEFSESHVEKPPNLITEDLLKVEKAVTTPSAEPQFFNNQDFGTNLSQTIQSERSSAHPSSPHTLQLRCVSNLLLSFPEFPHVQKLIAFLIRQDCDFTQILGSSDFKLIYQVIVGFTNTELQNIPRKTLEFVISLDISKYILIQDKFMTGYFYEKQKNKKIQYPKKFESEKKPIKKVEKKKKEEKTIMSKMDRKEEKIRKKFENKRYEEEGKISEEEQKKMELKICNGILKLFLLMMKRVQEYPLHDRKGCFHLVDLVFVGLRKLQPILKEDLLPGLKMMISDIITKSESIVVRLQGILAIIILFENKNLDLKGVREIALSLLKKITCDMTQIGHDTLNDQFSFKLLCKALRSLLLPSRVPSQEITEFLKYLMFLCSLTYSKMVFNLILEIKEFYEIEEYFTPIESVYRKMYYYC